MIRPGRLPHRRTRRPGYTWIELIVVVVVPAIALGLFVPATQNAREKRRPI